MIRTFHPVGQGAFYTEELCGENKFTVVYDCGSGTNEKIIKKQIRSKFDENQEIDAVFISHLHNDHVNGLEYLLSYCKVKKLFIPFLTNIEKINLLIQNGVMGIDSPFINELIVNPIDTISDLDNETVVVLVPNAGESGFNIENEPTLIGKVTTEVLKNNPKIRSCDSSNWIFIPYYMRHLEIHTDIETLLKEYGLTFSSIGATELDWNQNHESIDKFKEIWKNKSQRDVIVNRCSNIKDGLNANSMTLYSGPDLAHSSEFYIFLIHQCSNFNCCCNKMEMVGCMYFGDFDANPMKNSWNEFKKFYGKYWEQVGTIQIPHHGSRHNYNSEINQPPKFSIISAGYANKYRHPHISTLKEILSFSGVPIVINEFAGSFAMFLIVNSYQEDLLQCCKKYNL